MGPQQQEKASDNAQYVATPTPNDEIPPRDGTGKNDCYFLRWSRITKSVEVRDISQGLLKSSISRRNLDSDKKTKSIKGVERRTIINSVSGCAAPGELLALMGPSGSGKTSLLNMLSGRSSYDSGVLAINGSEVTPNSVKKLMSKIAYVKQADVFFNHLTVKDQLTYTALLRLPRSFPTLRKHQEVDRIVNLLRLNKVADSPIMLLSGGEKKRVNIGTELLTDPVVLMLDEPSSGLDSTSAVSLLNMLHELAQTQGKTIITSIHQPSSAVFRSFDRLLMLADGNVVYFGTPQKSLPYLRDKGLACPDGYNAADHWMDLLVVDSALEEEDDKNDLELVQDDTEVHDFDEHSKGGTLRRRHKTKDSSSTNGGKKKSPREELIAAWDGEAVAEQMDVLLIDDESSVGSSVQTGEGRIDFYGEKYNSSWITQFRTLCHRSLKNSRSALFTPVNLFKSAAIGLLCGLLWFQLDYTEKTVNDRTSYFFFTMTYWVFDSMFNSLMSFPEERNVILKERSSASYHLSAYFLAKTTSEAPTRLVLPLIYMVISFWLGGISPKFSVFFGTTCITLMSCLAGESIGLMIGASIYDFEKGIAVMTVFSLSLMLVGGFFVRNVPSFMDWLQYLSPFKFAFDGSRQLVFDRAVPCDGSGALEELCNGVDYGSATPEEVLEFIGVQGSVTFNVACLFVLFLIPRIVAYVALRIKKEGERA
mmetsp:Transcript_5239/g.7961  ORF Transcript_5239/g.7961 Transcript_5239/m.7961 type:complete len:705 (+) Transcript_5239:2-2116(+)